MILPSEGVPSLVRAGKTYEATVDSVCLSIGKWKETFDGCADEILTGGE